jgi:hypothetical protein
MTLLSIWPWDELAMDQAISLVGYWQEFPKVPIHQWLWGFRTVEHETSPVVILDP